MSEEKRRYNRIRVAIANKDIKNKDVAEALGVSQQTVSKWVNNTTQPTISQLYALADFLNTPPSELLEPWQAPS